MFDSLLGGFDGMFGGQRINSMMNSFFENDPFMNGRKQRRGRQRSQSTSLMPFEDDIFSSFGFPNMNQMMQSMGQVSNNQNCHSFSSNSIMTMTTGPDGKPQVYQVSESTRSAPGGIRETKKSVCDSRTGIKKLAIGRHIGDKGHVKEKEQNVYTGQLEENDEYINLEEEEESEFSKEWQKKTQHFKSHGVNQAISYPSNNRRADKYLALPPSSSCDKEPKHQQKENTGSPKKEGKLRRKKRRSKPYNKCEGKNPSRK